MNSLIPPLFTPSSGIHGDQNDPSFGGSAEKKSLHLDASDNGRPTWRSFASYWQFTIPLSLAFIAIAISSEVVLIHSQKNSGKARDSSMRVMRLIPSP